MHMCTHMSMCISSHRSMHMYMRMCVRTRIHISTPMSMHASIQLIETKRQRDKKKFWRKVFKMKGGERFAFYQRMWRVGAKMAKNGQAGCAQGNMAGMAVTIGRP